MTIAVVWKEDGVLWCAADTRLVAGERNNITTEVAAKIYSIPLSTSAYNPDLPLDLIASERRHPHYWTQYGFVYAGAALPASQTAITASTLLQNLVRPGGRGNPPVFEDVARLIHRLARRFMMERRQFGAEGLFQAAFFGWCPFNNIYRLAYIDGREDAGNFRVELSYPETPDAEGEPWLVLGSGTKAFLRAKNEYLQNEACIRKRVPRRVIDKMVAEALDEAVGGATSIGAAYPDGFQLFYAVEPVEHGKPAARRVFNGLDLDAEIGCVGQYAVAFNGIA